MGLVLLPELSLDSRSTFVPKTISDFLKDGSMIGNVSERRSKLDDFVKRLEEEMRKIDAFKRELPLCMLLLNDAILALKKELFQPAAANSEPPVFEEFIPLKKDSDENEKEKDYKDKKSWMSSVQLWNTDSYSKDQAKRKGEEQSLATEDPFRSYENRREGRAYMPFEACFPFHASMRKNGTEEVQVQAHSLLTRRTKNPREQAVSTSLRSSENRGVSTSPANVQSNLTGTQQLPARKQRRCWSPELHRRFINALQELGGSQVATPKQLRELMQVDGLTNDEVKSHLQKYRLHARRLPAAAAGSTDQSVVHLGGLWSSQDQSGESSKASSLQSHSPQGPLQLPRTGGTSTTGCDSIEDNEDAKSESYSWKSRVPEHSKDDV